MLQALTLRRLRQVERAKRTVLALGQIAHQRARIWSPSTRTMEFCKESARVRSSPCGCRLSDMHPGQALDPASGEMCD